ncbi:hypothetical protein C1645_874229 [Glomus cerebriforme]|uniref:Uncharacterized protein n=1 Tax=Glomus cerebriforme TaxID=658196 RepID=A0A397T4F3_9GLOM|nr:hypothetical protein C1645_874229 [Glomus cerebriforme]
MNSTFTPVGGTSFNFFMDGNHMNCTFDYNYMNCTSVKDNSIIDNNYTTSDQDLFDGILNALFPIFFFILLNVKNSSTSKKNALPILDDLLYNIVTWLIPLVVSFVYDDSRMKIFALLNMFLNITCTAFAIKINYRLKEMEEAKWKKGKIPEDFLATSTACVQYYIRNKLTKNRKTFKFYIVKAEDFDGKTINFMNNNNEKDLWELFKLQKGISVPLKLLNGIELNISIVDDGDNKKLEFYIVKAKDFDGKTIEFVVDGNSCKVDYKKDSCGPYYIENIRNFDCNSSLKCKRRSMCCRKSKNNIQYNLHGLFKLQEGILFPLNLPRGIELKICVFDENKKTLKFYIDETNINIGNVEFMVRKGYDNCKCEERDICNICKEYKEYDIREDYKKSDPRKVHYIPNIGKDLIMHICVNNKMDKFPLKDVFELQDGSLFRSPELIEGIFLIMTTIECGKIEKFDDNEEKAKSDDNEEKAHSMIGIENDDDAIMIENNDM